MHKCAALSLLHFIPPFQVLIFHVSTSKLEWIYAGVGRKVVAHCLVVDIRRQHTLVPEDST